MPKQCQQESNSESSPLFLIISQLNHLGMLSLSPPSATRGCVMLGAPFCIVFGCCEQGSCSPLWLHVRCMSAALTLRRSNRCGQRLLDVLPRKRNPMCHIMPGNRHRMPLDVPYDVGVVHPTVPDDRGRERCHRPGEMRSSGC